jgi:Na+/proline symporter
METLDIVIVAAALIAFPAIGIWAARRASQSTEEYFLSGRNMPWWLLGVSMVATTFSADTPNLVTDLGRNDGVMGNWAWWAFLLTGMLTTFVYARLWRRSGMLTDLEFYELRYGGKPAAFLRGFRAVYLGLVFNCLVMATVSLAGIKIGAAMLGLAPIQSLLLVGVLTLAYSVAGGLRGVIISDFFQFTLAMIGSIGACLFILKMPEIGGLNQLLVAEEVQGKLNILPDFNDSKTLIPLLIIPLAVQWWSTWYPGAEPGGGGYVAQRMLAAKDENHALGATMLFNFAHYALRPWPWILVALASLVIFPDLDSLRVAFPDLPEDKIGHDLAYPAMLSKLPAGLFGIVLASLIAALMSTLSTHLNWGASYIVNDFWARFLEEGDSDGNGPSSETEKKRVNIGRIVTVILFVISMLLALGLGSALQAFSILLQIGAGTGLVFILRWFWSRINAWSEISAMVASLAVAIIFQMEIFGGNLEGHQQLLLGVGITTVIWLLVTLLTPKESPEVLEGFYARIWPNRNSSERFSGLPIQVLAMLLGTLAIWSALFATGYFIYGNSMGGFLAAGICLVAGTALWRIGKSAFKL